MNHSYFSDRLSAFKDGELPPYEQAALAKHIKDCPECQAALAELEKLDQLIKEQSHLSESDYWERQARAIEERLPEAQMTDVRPARQSRGLIWKWASVAASVAVLTFIGLHQSDIFRDESLIPLGEVDPTINDGTVDRDFHDSLAVIEGKKDTSNMILQSKGLTEQPGQAAGSSRSPEAIRISPRIYPLQVPRDSLAHLDLSTTADTANRSLMEATPKAEKTKRQQRSSIQADKKQTQPTDIVDMVAAPIVEIIHPVPGDLERWRRASDSLTRLLLSHGKRRGLIEKPERGDSADSAANEEERISADQLEAELLQASFYLASLSADSAEIRRATELIEGVATDEKSANRWLAEQYLRQLKEKTTIMKPAKK